jgi:hypothetical protein
MAQQQQELIPNMNLQVFQDQYNQNSLDPINELNSIYEQENSAYNNSVN